MIRAHAGGWDEILLFALPVVILLLGIGVAERRRKTGSDSGHPDSEAEPTTIPPHMGGDES